MCIYNHNHIYIYDYIYIRIYIYTIIYVYELNLLRLSYIISLPAPSPLWIFAKFQGFCRQQLPFVRHTELEGRCHGHNTFAAVMVRLPWSIKPHLKLINLGHVPIKVVF